VNPAFGIATFFAVAAGCAIGAAWLALGGKPPAMQR